MQIGPYLDRIHHLTAIRTDPAALYELHRAHMLAVPFENLDISEGRDIQLSEEALWDKIVVRKRGGFCYELNGLFAYLLKQIGFDITYLNARVFDREGKLGIDFDHLALLTRIPNRAGIWLVDVGFGDSFTKPLNFEEPGEQVQGLRSYRLEKTNEGFITWQRNYDGTWERMYFFDLEPRAFPKEYEAACLYHQTSPQSSFTRGSIISLATPHGRISLEDGWLITTRNGHREKRAVAKEEYPILLKECFGVVL
jgi:N-hydroxyarylamine O-acetyltransferase